MLIGEHVGFAQLDQVDQGMMYPDSPPEAMGMPYRVSAIISNSTGAPSGGETVGFYDQNGKLLGSKKTDSMGKVFFDVAGANPITIKPENSGASPPYIVMTAMPISVGALLYLFKSSWSWTDSVRFSVYASGMPVPAGIPPVAAGELDWSTILLIGGAVFVLYTVYQGHRGQ